MQLQQLRTLRTMLSKAGLNVPQELQQKIKHEKSAKVAQGEAIVKAICQNVVQEHYFSVDQLRRELCALHREQCHHPDY